MASWAAIARRDAAKPSVENVPVGQDNSRMLIVDANAIISGIRLEGLGDKAVTILEVLDEIRDKQSRDFLATLPFGIEVREPSEESIAAVSRFARMTGDIHTLSAVDIKVLALAHNLELVAHGSAHLREQPVQVKLRSKQRFKGKGLPGWGNVPNPEDWKAIDEVEDDGNNNAGGRILQQQDQVQLQGGDIASVAAGSTGTAASGLEHHEFDDDGEDDDEGGEADGAEDDDWQTAAKSHNAARRNKRRQMRREAWEARQAAAQLASTSMDSGKAASHAPEQLAKGSKPVSGGEARNAADLQPPAAHSAANGHPPQPGAVGKDEPVPGGEAGNAAQESRRPAPADGPVSSDAGQDAGGEQSGNDGENQGETEEDDQSGDGDEEEGSSGEEEDEEEEEEGSEDGSRNDEGASECSTSHAPAFESRISTITADFAMQNVLLQMGLRLVTRDGRRITRLSRWALRCSACTFVSKEAGRLFCPRCGNMAMERVEVSIGPDGRELYGVRKKHSLRGTRYSLPKPKGGRNSKAPILREDQLLQRMAGKNRKRNTAAPGADAFAPEFGMDTLFRDHQAVNSRVMAMVPNPKNNPNERKPMRSNRRK